LKSWVATTYAHAIPAGGFKNCCLPSGKFDGSRRNHFFPSVEAKEAGQPIVVPLHL
jgi:hypothetical protein